MFFIPFPFVIAEVLIFVVAVRHFGFWMTVGYYLLPCLLGFFIVSTVGRYALMTLQASVSKGKLPANQILHSGAIFISGLLFLVPSFFTRIFGLILFLPGSRHFLVWRFKLKAAEKMAKGSARIFNFGNFGGGGFRYYQHHADNPGFDGAPEERDVTGNEVLDVNPLEITHEKKKD